MPAFVASDPQRIRRADTMSDTIKEHADGIYLDMPDNEYHADTALGASGICDLLVSPVVFWRNSPMNAERVDEQTEASLFGDYFHAIMDEREEPYCVKPAGMSFSTKEGKAFKEQNGDKIFVPFDTHTKARNMARAVREFVAIGQKAASEVSYFWTDKSGYRCKIRIDRLCIDQAFDWKTVSNSMNKDTDTLIAHTVAAHRYHIKAFWYQTGINHMLDQLKKKGHPTVRQGILDSDIAAALAARQSTLPFWYVFVESNHVPEIVVRRFVSHDANGGLNAYARAAINAIDRATGYYAQFMKSHGPDRPWRHEVHQKAFADEDFTAARWMLEEE
jgi:PDDEXK-like domain of unknown function (DUF3799)